MGKNRDSLRIVADILNSINLGANKTKIMFSANLSFKLLEKYLTLVINSGLVQINGSTYELTIHGQEFIKKYESFQEHTTFAYKLLESLDFERKNLSLML